MKTREQIEVELNEVDYVATTTVVIAVSFFSTLLTILCFGLTIWALIASVVAFLTSSLLTYLNPIKKGDY